MAKKLQRGLGRGLGALLGDDTPETEPVPAQAAAASGDEARELPIASIDTDPNQPRKDFKEEALRELAESIRSVGVLQPIIVCPSGSGRYTIVAGERRYRAARLADLETIPAIVRDWDAQKRLEAALVENLQRDDLNPIEEASGVKRLMDETGMTQEKAAERLGKSRPAVANLLRLLTLPDMVLRMIEDGRLTAGHGRALVSVDRKRQMQLANLCVEQGWSVRQLERVCAQQTQQPEKPQKPKRDPQMGKLEGMAREFFGTRARLDGDENNGKLTLYYYSREDLQRIWDVLAMNGGEA